MGRRLSVADISDLRDRYEGEKPEQNIWISGDVENLRHDIYIKVYKGLQCLNFSGPIRIPHGRDKWHPTIAQKVPFLLPARAPKVIRAPDRDRIICTRSSLLSLARISSPWNTWLKETHIEECDLLLPSVKAEVRGPYTNVCW